MIARPAIRRRSTDRSITRPASMPLFSLRPLSFIVALVVLGACADTQPKYIEKPVGILYNDAMDKLAEGEYFDAARAFDEVERQHPYSSWAIKAKLMSSFAYQQASRYDEAILAARRFIELHPGNADIAYAYYLLAIAYYEQIQDVGRDQKVTQLALGALDEVVRRFPNSEYARDARLKVDLTRDHLAGKEMAIGRYYLKRGSFVAAINRFRAVIERFQSTTHVPEALHRLTEAYLALGVAEEAQTAAAVLGYNFPNSEWYEDAYGLLRGRNLEPKENRGSWISRIWRGVF
jgi:outer membrane protein assembly factor BamD